MSTAKSTTHSAHGSRFLFVDADPESQAAASRRRVIETMKDAVLALNSGIQHLESTGNFDEAEIDRSWERLLRAVEWFEGERARCELTARRNPNHRRGSIREVA